MLSVILGKWWYVRNVVQYYIPDNILLKFLEFEVRHWSYFACNSSHSFVLGVDKCLPQRLKPASNLLLHSSWKENLNRLDRLKRKLLQFKQLFI